jgi:hypothetical protein
MIGQDGGSLVLSGAGRGLNTGHATEGFVIMRERSEPLLRPLTALALFATDPIPVQAQGHYKSFIVSTYAIQGTVQESRVRPEQNRKLNEL